MAKSLKNPKKCKQYKKWSFAILNKSTGAEKDNGANMYSVVKQLAKSDKQFLLLQEFPWKNTGSKIIQPNIGEKCEFHWCGYQKKREAGVGVLIKVDKHIKINNANFTDPRVMGIDLEVIRFNLTIVNAY